MKIRPMSSVFLGLVLLGACSEVEVRTSNLSPGTRKIHVPPVIVGIREEGIGRDLLQRVLQGFEKDGRLLVTEEGGAEAALIIRLQSYHVLTREFDANNRPVRRKMHLAVDLDFVELPARRLAWTTRHQVHTGIHIGEGHSPGSEGLDYDSTNPSTMNVFESYWQLNNMGKPVESEDAVRNRLLDRLAATIINRVVKGIIKP